jgi:hypothetical protein
VQRARDAGVVRVRVGEDYGFDVVQTESEGGDLTREVPLEAWKTCVDRSQPATIFDEVPVDDRVAKSVDARDDVGSGFDGA